MLYNLAYARLGSTGAASRQLAARIDSAMVQAVEKQLKNQAAKQQGIPEILQRFTKLPGDNGQRFRTTQEVLEHVQATLKLLADGRDDWSVQSWRDAKHEFGQNIARAASGSTVNINEIAWKALSQLEERMVRAIDGKFDSNIARALEQEAKEEAQRKQDATKAWKDEFATRLRALSALAPKGQLLDQTRSGVEALVTAITDVRVLAKQEGSLTTPEVAVALKSAEVACKRYCEHPERRNRQKLWLKQQGFGHCEQLLEANDLLDCLGHLADECRGKKQLPEPWCAAGLPLRVQDGLFRAALSGKLRRNKFDILDNEVPHGWSRVFSNNVGLHYFRQLYGEGQQWEWPTEPEPAATINEPAPPTQDPAATRLLEKDLEHWRSLTNIAQRLQKQLEGMGGESVGGKPAQASEGLCFAWCGEFAAEVASFAAPSDIRSRFWHGVVKPHMDVEDTASALIKAFSAVREGARSHEPVPPTTTHSATSSSHSLSGAAPPSKSASGLANALKLGEQLLQRLNRDGRILKPGNAGCTEVVALLKDLQVAVDSCTHEEDARIKPAKDALVRGRDAVLRHCERPARERMSAKWLRRHGLGHCAALLEDGALLDRLEDLAKAPSLAEGLGMPRSCLTRLSAALGDGRAAADALALGPLPVGWETRISSSTGLSYFVNKDGAQRWDRPAPPDDPEEPLNFPAAPFPTSSFGSAGLGSTADRLVPPSDLCDEAAGPEHLRGTKHSGTAAEWKELVKRAEPLLQEMQQGPSTRGQQPPTRRSALQIAWRGELLAAVRNKGEGSSRQVPARIEAVFWHRVVEPCIAPLGRVSKSM